MKCCLFGHRDCPDTMRDDLREVLTDLICQDGVTMFYVGNQGEFDAIARKVLRALKKSYPQVEYAVVLAYMPGKTVADADYSDTMLPEGIERVPPRFAISWRNQWMLREAEVVVTYVTRSLGNTAKLASQAERQGKRCINIAKNRK